MAAQVMKVGAENGFYSDFFERIVFQTRKSSQRKHTLQCDARPVGGLAIDADLVDYLSF